MFIASCSEADWQKTMVGKAIVLTFRAKSPRLCLSTSLGPALSWWPMKQQFIHTFSHRDDKVTDSQPRSGEWGVCEKGEQREEGKHREEHFVSVKAKLKGLGNKGGWLWLWLKIKAWRWLWLPELLAESSRKRLFFTILMALRAACKGPKLQKESETQGCKLSQHPDFHLEGERLVGFECHVAGKTV